MNPIKNTIKDINSYLILTGISFIFFAILVIIFPDILAYLVAILFMLAGLYTLYYGIRIGRVVKKAENSLDKYFKEEDKEE